MSQAKTFQEVYGKRRSIRKYDTAVKVKREEMLAILDETLKTPSSFNMIPYRFVVVDSPEEKLKLKPYMRFNQEQTETAAALIFIFGDYQCFDYGEEIYGEAVARGLMPKEVKQQQMAQLSQYYAQVSRQELKERILLDGGLLSTSLMLVAREHGYDTCPMGGFEKAQMAEVLGLDSDRYFPILAISLGKAADAGYPSYRLPAEKITFWR